MDCSARKAESSEPRAGLFLGRPEAEPSNRAPVARGVWGSTRAFFHTLGERLAPELIRDGLVFLRQASAILGDAKATGRSDPRRK